MPINRGKQFEAKFKKNFEETVPNCSIDRIYDVTGFMYGVSNICDFICYSYPNIFYCEIKTHKGNTFPLANLTQYSKLIYKVGIKGVRAGVIIWFQNHDKVIYVPIKTIAKMKRDDVKSVNITKIDKQGYRYIEIPSIKKRVMMDSDYSVLLNLQEGD